MHPGIASAHFEIRKGPNPKPFPRDPLFQNSLHHYSLLVVPAVQNPGTKILPLQNPRISRLASSGHPKGSLLQPQEASFFPELHHLKNYRFHFTQILHLFDSLRRLFSGKTHRGPLPRSKKNKGGAFSPLEVWRNSLD
jgi:hypothetical protein